MMKLDLNEILKDCGDGFELSVEARKNIESKSDKDSKSIYILLTDTNTTFSNFSKMITGQPYNHISVMLEPNFDEIYTYALTNVNGISGGFKKENRGVLDGASYSLYKIDVTDESHENIKGLVFSKMESAESTSYNHLGLFNTIFDMDIFESPKESMICSEFAVEVLRSSGLEIFKEKSSSRIKPYDIVKSRMLQFVQRGKIKKSKIMKVKD